MVLQLDEPFAAVARVMGLRLSAIPGLAPDVSQCLLIRALEQPHPCCQTILPSLGKVPDIGPRS